MTMKYAKYTKVPVEQSRAEIEKTLMRYGADTFMYGRSATETVIGFQMAGVPIQLRLPMPDDEQEQRQVMRILLLMLKSKLEMIAMEYTTVEREFMADILLKDGQTVGEWMIPQLQSGAMPKALPMPGQR